MSPAVHRSSCCMEYICIYRVVSSPDLLCHRCSWSSLLCRSIWSTPCTTWNPVELSSKTGTHDSDTLVYANPEEKETLGICVCALVVLTFGQVGVAHPWWVAVCPLLDSSRKTVPFLPHWHSSKDFFVVEDNSQSFELLEMFVIKIQQLEGITDQRHKCLCQIIVDLPWLPNRLLALTVEGRVCVLAWKCVEHR